MSATARKGIESRCNNTEHGNHTTVERENNIQFDYPSLHNLYENDRTANYKPGNNKGVVGCYGSQSACGRPMLDSVILALP